MLLVRPAILYAFGATANQAFDRLQAAFDFLQISV